MIVIAYRNHLGEEGSPANFDTVYGGDGAVVPEKASWTDRDDATIRHGQHATFIDITTRPDRQPRPCAEPDADSGREANVVRQSQTRSQDGLELRATVCGPSGGASG